MKLIYPPQPKWESLESPFRNIRSSNALVNGKWTEKVEKEICKIHDCKYCVLTSSATTAFMLLLKTVEKYYKFEYIAMQDFTWESTKQIVEWLYPECIGYFDIKKKDWIMNEPVGLPKNNDVLLIPNMTFGNIKDFKHKNTIYDSAHCLGNPKCNGRGRGEIISFSPAKMVTGAEGGCVITNDKKIYDEVLKLRKFHGRISEFNAAYLYFNIIENLEKELERKEEIDMDYMYDLGPDFYSWVHQEESWCNIPNEIVYTHPKMNSKKRKELSKHFDIRLRYKPWNKNNKNSKWIYDHQIVLPQVDNDEREKVKKAIKDVI